MSHWLNPCTSEEVIGTRRHRVEISIKPRAFLQGGYYRAIPAALSNIGDASLPIGRAGLLDTRFADKLAGQSPQVHIGRGQNHIRMSALGTNNVNGAAVLDGVGNIIGRRYNGAWAGADLEWIDIGHKVKEHVYLWTGHPKQIEVRVDSFAGKLVASNRGWDLQDDAGRPVLWAGAGYLYKPDDPTALTVAVKTTVRTQGGKQIYTYTLPEGDWAGWVLDPTWSAQPGAAEGKDTRLGEVAPNTNYGIVSILYTQWATILNGGKEHGILEFNLATLPSGTILTAFITLTGTSFGGSASTTNLHRLTQAWEELEATWNVHTTGNAWASPGGDFHATVYASQAFTAIADFVQDIAPLVRGWVAGTWPNYGLLIKHSTESGSSAYSGFAPSDHATAAWWPKLEVVWIAPSGSGRGRTAVLGRHGW